MTPTGAARVNTAFGDTVHHVYIPYDVPSAVNRFLNTMHPVVAVIMETRIVAEFDCALSSTTHSHLSCECAFIGKIRQWLSHRIAPLTQEMLQHIDAIAAHGQADAERFIALGAPRERMEVTGNIKFDVELPVDLPAQKNHGIT